MLGHDHSPDAKARLRCIAINYLANVTESLDGKESSMLRNARTFQHILND
jgi:hypothetical protein